MDFSVYLIHSARQMYRVNLLLYPYLDRSLRYQTSIYFSYSSPSHEGLHLRSSCVQPVLTYHSNPAATSA